MYYVNVLCADRVMFSSYIPEITLWGNMWWILWGQCRGEYTTAKCGCWRPGIYRASVVYTPSAIPAYSYYQSIFRSLLLMLLLTDDPSISSVLCSPTYTQNTPSTQPGTAHHQTTLPKTSTNDPHSNRPLPKHTIFHSDILNRITDTGTGRAI